MAGKRQIEARWGVEFWKLVSDFAEQGLSRFDTARALGYHPHSFCYLLASNPGKDPYEPFIRAAAYLKDTGETIRQALERMAAEGRSWGYAARVIGYSDGYALKRTAEARGIAVEMTSVHGRPRKREERKALREPGISGGWPSWEKIYEIGGGPVPQQRRKKCQNK